MASNKDVFLVGVKSLNSIEIDDKVITIDSIYKYHIKIEWKKPGEKALS